MVVPIIASLSRDLFLTVPRELEEGAEALGATRWEVIRGVVLPSTASGVAAAIVLGLGRALGEAIAVPQVIGAGTAIHASLFATGDTLASRIALAVPRLDSPQHTQALFYLAVILLVIGLVDEPDRTGRSAAASTHTGWSPYERAVRPHGAARGFRQPPPARGGEPPGRVGRDRRGAACDRVLAIVVDSGRRSTAPGF